MSKTNTVGCLDGGNVIGSDDEFLPPSEPTSSFSGEYDSLDTALYDKTLTPPISGDVRDNSCASQFSKKSRIEAEPSNGSLKAEFQLHSSLTEKEEFHDAYGSCPENKDQDPLLSKRPLDQNACDFFNTETNSKETEGKKALHCSTTSVENTHKEPGPRDGEVMIKRPCLPGLMFTQKRASVNTKRGSTESEEVIFSVRTLYTDGKPSEKPKVEIQELNIPFQQTSEQIELAAASTADTSSRPTKLPLQVPVPNNGDAPCSSKQASAAAFSPAGSPCSTSAATVPPPLPRHRHSIATSSLPRTSPSSPPQKRKSGLKHKLAGFFRRLTVNKNEPPALPPRGNLRSPPFAPPANNEFDIEANEPIHNDTFSIKRASTLRQPSQDAATGGGSPTGAGPSPSANPIYSPLLDDSQSPAALPGKEEELLATATAPPVLPRRVVSSFPSLPSGAGGPTPSSADALAGGGAAGATLKYSEDARFMLESLQQLRHCSWYWGPLSNKEAELVLAGHPDGTFLVRDSCHDRYLLSLSFNRDGHTFHTRMQHFKGFFSFFNLPDSYGRFTIVDFIDTTVENCRFEKFKYYTKPNNSMSPPRELSLLYPLSRFSIIPTLRHLARFAVLQMVRVDLIKELPVPINLMRYLSDPQYYAELDNEEMFKLPTENLHRSPAAAFPGSPSTGDRPLASPNASSPPGGNTTTDCNLGVGGGELGLEVAGSEGENVEGAAAAAAAVVNDDLYLPAALAIEEEENEYMV